MGLVLIEDAHSWDQFIDKSPYGLLFHKWGFLKTIETHSGYKFLPYGIYKGESLICVIPLFYKKTMGFKALFSPPPESGVPYLGLVMCSEFDFLKQNKKESFLNTAVDEIHGKIAELSPHYTHISFVPNFIDLRAFIWQQYDVNTGYTYTIDLSQPLESIWSNFQRELRRQIRQGEKLNLKLVSSSNISILYQLLQERYQEQGLNLPIMSRSYLEDLLGLYQQYISVYYLYNQNNEIIGANMVHEYKRYISWIGATRTKDAIYGNEYLIWQLIKIAQDKGFKKFELQGANKKNLCQFKSKFNPSLELVFDLTKQNVLGQLAKSAYFTFCRKRWM